MKYVILEHTSKQTYYKSGSADRGMSYDSRPGYCAAESHAISSGYFEMIDGKMIGLYGKFVYKTEPIDGVVLFPFGGIVGYAGKPSVKYSSEEVIEWLKINYDIDLGQVAYIKEDGYLLGAEETLAKKMGRELTREEMTKIRDMILSFEPGWISPDNAMAIGFTGMPGEAIINKIVKMYKVE